MGNSIAFDVMFNDSSEGIYLAMPQSVPEPTSMIPLGIGLVAVGGYTFYRRGKSSKHS